MNEQDAMMPKEPVRVCKEVNEQLPLGHIQSGHIDSLNEANLTAAECSGWLAPQPGLEPRPEEQVLPAEGLAADDQVPTASCKET